MDLVSPKKAPVWKSVLTVIIGVVLVLVIIVAALWVYASCMGHDPGEFFPGNSDLNSAAGELASAENILRRRPDDDEAHIQRASAFLTLGHLEGVRLEWETWRDDGGSEWGSIGRSLEELELKTDEIRALLHDAEISLHPSDLYPPIYSLLDDIAERYEGIPEYRALFLKGYLLLREGRRAEAEPIFSNELDNYHPLRDYVMYNYGRSLIVAGTEEQALDVFEEFLGEYPSSRLAPLAHLENINILRDLSRTDDAVTECRRMLDRYPTSAFASKALRKWAEILEETMDFDSGAEVRVRILRDYPESAETAETVEMFFDGVYALRHLDDSDRLEVAYAGLWDYPSDALEVLSELADSENLSPDERAMACHGACRSEFLLGHYYECIDWGNRARDLAPGSEYADRSGIRIAWAYNRLDKGDRAMEAFREVAEGRGPLAALGAESLYDMAYGLRNLETVREMCTLIVEEYPTSDQIPDALAMLAYLGCRDGRYQSARGHAETCVTNFPDHPASVEAGFWLARSLVGLGRIREADDAYEELANRNPWNYWGIRAMEIADPNIWVLSAVDPMDFDIERLSCFDGDVAAAWELYDVGTLELAEDEFNLALENDGKGARCGLALIHVEQDRMREGILSLREAAARGDQAYLTPARQQKILDNLYPRPFETEVITAALAHDVPSSWLWGAMRQESAYNSNARSGSDARGLIQIMPQTGRFIADRRGADTFDPETLWDPELNLDFSAWYFSYLRHEVGGDRLLDVLAAYNGGPGALRRYRQQLPTRDNDIFISAIPTNETRNFARWVYANIRMYDYILDMEGYQTVPF